MADDDWMDPIRAAWMAQTVDVPRIEPEAFRTWNSQLDATLRRRNRRELAAAVVGVLWFGSWAWLAGDAVVRIGCLLVIAGTMVLVATLFWRGTPPAVTDNHLAWRIRTLEQQRDLLASIWWWYLGPLVPGLAVTLVGMARSTSDPWVIGLVGVVCAAAFAVVGWINRKAARQMDREIDELKELEDA